MPGTLIKVAQAYHVEVRPLVGALAEAAREPGVVYAAASWHDIILALYGPEALA